MHGGLFPLGEFERSGRQRPESSSFALGESHKGFFPGSPVLLLAVLVKRPVMHEAVELCECGRRVLHALDTHRLASSLNISFDLSLILGMTNARGINKGVV